MSRRQVDNAEGPTHFIYGGDHAVGSFMQVWDERFAGSKFDPQGEGYVLDCDEMFGISLNLIDAHPEDLKNQEKIRGLVNIYISSLGLDQPKIFKVNWERVITEAFGPWDYGWTYNPDDWDFMTIIAGSSDSDIIKLRDAIAVQAKEQGIIKY